MNRDLFVLYFIAVMALGSTVLQWFAIGSAVVRINETQQAFIDAELVSHKAQDQLNAAIFKAIELGRK